VGQLLPCHNTSDYVAILIGHITGLARLFACPSIFFLENKKDVKKVTI